ncbi:MAG: Bax inhibitor-1/YccA family protein, partial [Actinomycetes bacterium]
MQSTNPVLKQSRYATFDSATIENGINRASTDRMGIDDVVTRTGILLAVLLVAAVATYVVPLTGVLFFGALIIG